MHAIQRYHYIRLQEYLNVLKRESEIWGLPDEHHLSIIQQEIKLKELYNNYQEVLKDVAELIKEYQKEDKSVRRLISIHKQHTRQLQKKEFIKQNI
jgi:hypothetical protein